MSTAANSRQLSESLEMSENDEELHSIEESFKASWDEIVRYYTPKSQSTSSLGKTIKKRLVNILGFIDVMRKENYDEWFRAAIFFQRLQLSRKVKLNMQASPYIEFEFHYDSMDIRAEFNGGQIEVTVNQFKLTSEVEPLLELLKTQPIN